MAESKYSAESIQVLSGLEPVRRRPGMYTDTSRPNHLVQEVVDNSVDEALGGYAREIHVALFDDGSVEVIDDGRGMPVDIHPEHKVSGVELILTRLPFGRQIRQHDLYVLRRPPRCRRVGRECAIDVARSGGETRWRDSSSALRTRRCR